LRQLAADGVAVVIASSDVEELIEACDRVLVVGSGRVWTEIDGADLDERAVNGALVAASAS
jgi:ribose transport system ATP-binding protein